MDESTGVPSLSKTTINKVRNFNYHLYLEAQIKIGEYFSCLGPPNHSSPAKI